MGKEPEKTVLEEVLGVCCEGENFPGLSLIPVVGQSVVLYLFSLRSPCFGGTRSVHYPASRFLDMIQTITYGMRLQSYHSHSHMQRPGGTDRI